MFLTTLLISITLWTTAFLCLLNTTFAIVFRRRSTSEVLSYVGVGLIELLIFAFTLALRLGILTHVPYHLPPKLPFNRAEIGAALAIGIGLFPAAYWHRTSLSQMRERIALDAKTMKQRESGVHIRSDVPGEWMN